MSKDENTSFDFPVGKIVGAHGIKGHIKIRPSSNNPRLFAKLKTVLLTSEKNVQVEQNISTIDIDRKMFLVKLSECNTRNDAEALVGHQVHTQKNQLQKLNEDEWWITDLVGLDVFAKTGEKVGTVSNIFGEQGEWLEISLLEKEGKTALIPFVKELVPLVDVAAGRVEINTEVQGLLD